MPTYTSHNKICYACGQEKRRRQLGYDIRTLKTYCKQGCPNHADIPNVDLVELRTEDLREALEKTYSEELLQVFNRILGKTVSARPNPALAMHIMKTAQKHELTSISEVLTFMLERDFKEHEITEDLAPIEPEAEEVEVEIMEPEPVPEQIALPDPNRIEPIQEGKPYDFEKMQVPQTPEELEDLKDRIEKHQEAIKIIINEKPIEPEQEEKEDESDEFAF